MTEVQLLAIFSKSTGTISEPFQTEAVSIAGVDHLMVRSFRKDDTQNPPIADMDTISYYVKDRGKPEESAFLSINRNTKVVIDSVKDAAIS